MVQVGVFLFMSFLEHYASISAYRDKGKIFLGVTATAPTAFAKFRSTPTRSVGSRRPKTQPTYHDPLPGIHIYKHGNPSFSFSSSPTGDT
jgi:hypothetical protein